MLCGSRTCLVKLGLGMKGVVGLRSGFFFGGKGVYSLRF